MTNEGGKSGITEETENTGMTNEAEKSSLAGEAGNVGKTGETCKGAAPTPAECLSPDLHRWRWPARSHLWHYLKIMGALYLLFALVYGGANYWAAQQPVHYHYFAEWERALPWLPGFIYVYFSIGLLFCLPLFVLTTRQISQLGRAAASCMGVAGICFVLWPGTVGFVDPHSLQQLDPLTRWLFAALMQWDKPYNTAPSLHVALSVLVACATCWPRLQPRWLAWGVWCWLALILVSVVLVHQHHMLDVVTGALLGLAGFVVYRRALASSP